jgi:hypothetical protein
LFADPDCEAAGYRWSVDGATLTFETVAIRAATVGRRS